MRVNDPYHGGTCRTSGDHPVFNTGGEDVILYRSRAPRRNRRHHPGSMPADSREIHEGVLFGNFGCSPRTDGSAGRPAPAYRGAVRFHNPDTNLADLRAQIAANQRGVDEVGKMIDHFGATWWRPCATSGQRAGGRRVIDRRQRHTATAWIQARRRRAQI